MSLFTIFALCGLGYALVSPNVSVQPQLHPSGDFKTIKSSKSTRQKAISLVEGEIGTVEDPELLSCSQKASASSSFEGIKNKLVRNTFFMVGLIPMDNGQERRLRARCIGLYGHTFLVIHHYIEHFKSLGIEEVSIVYHNAMGCVKYRLEDIKFKWTAQGYGMGELPSSAPRQFANITKFIPSEKFNGSYPYSCEILEVHWDSFQTYSVDAAPLNKPLHIPSNSTMSGWDINQGFSYKWAGKGKCGSLLLAPGMASPVIGIHTAGAGTNIGYSELLLRETFIDSDDIVVEFVTPNMQVHDNVYNLDGEYEIVGQLDQDLTIMSPTVSKILPSDIAPVFPITTEPAPLTRHDPRLEEPFCPFYLGVSKRCKKMKEFPSALVQSAFLDVVHMFRSSLKPLRWPSVLSVKESIEGLEIPGYEPIEMTTSEGYPWVKLRPKIATDKSWMFKFSFYDNGRRKLEGVIPELYAVLEMKNQLRERYKVPATYFTACLKDARILKEKISIPGKTRIFEISPVDLTISQRQYFLDFNASYQAGRLEMENSIGINPDSMEWTYLVDKLLSNSQNIITADYSGYGPTMSTEVLMRAFDAIIAWYEDFERDEEEASRSFAVRYTMKYEIAKALHVAKNLVFRPVAGMPSGNCATVIINSVVNSLYIRIAFLGLAKENAPQYQDLYWFKNFVVLIHNGDDLIMSVKDEIIGWFNNESLISFFGRFDLKMTDALKKGIVQKFCSIEEATYLKRGFAKHPTRSGVWLAPLEESSITDTANWIWKSVNSRDASLVNSEMCARLAYSRGPIFYSNIVRTLEQRWMREGVCFRAPSWNSLDMHVFEGTMGPLFSFDVVPSL